MSGDWVKPDDSLGLGSGVKRGGKVAPREGKSGSTMGGVSTGVLSGDVTKDKHFHDRPSGDADGIEFSVVQFDGDGLSK